MIEKIVRDHLEQQLTVPVLMEIPPDAPEIFVVVEKTGGGVVNRAILTAVFAVQSYGATMAEAAQLNEQVKTAMEVLSQQDNICRVQLNTDYNFTDTVSKRYRYQAVFDITYYREERLNV